MDARLPADAKTGAAFEGWFQEARPRLMEGLPDFLTGEDDEDEVRGIAWLAFKGGVDYKTKSGGLLVERAESAANAVALLCKDQPVEELYAAELLAELQAHRGFLHECICALPSTRLANQLERTVALLMSIEDRIQERVDPEAFRALKRLESRSLDELLS